MQKNKTNNGIFTLRCFEFYNPKAEKETIVGFEAASPVGDTNDPPVNGYHLYMQDFTANMNDRTRTSMVNKKHTTF